MRGSRICLKRDSSSPWSIYQPFPSRLNHISTCFNLEWTQRKHLQSLPFFFHRRHETFICQPFCFSPLKRVCLLYLEWPQKKYTPPSLSAIMWGSRIRTKGDVSPWSANLPHLNASNNSKNLLKVSHLPQSYPFAWKNNLTQARTDRPTDWPTFDICYKKLVYSWLWRHLPSLSTCHHFTKRTNHSPTTSCRYRHRTGHHLA